MPRIAAILTATLLTTTALTLTGCEGLRFPGVYRIDIPQGNFVTEDMLNELKPGMTRDQVCFVIGAPTLVDPFTPNVWFYPMTYRPGKGEPSSQRITVYFDGDTYTHYSGEVLDDLKAKTSADKDRQLHEKAQEHQDSE